MHGRGVRTGAGLSVTLELTSRELLSGRWSKGGEAELVVASPDGAPRATVTAPVPPGARSLVADVPLAAGGVGPWRVRSRVRAGAHLIEQTFEVLAPSDGLLGGATWFRGASAASAPMRPAAEPLFRRTERLRIEWMADVLLDSRVGRLLDRRGEPLAVSATTTELERNGQRIVAVDLGLSPLAEGDYVVELAAGQGGRTVRRLEALRVIR
jgi:hypothetical protein